jgi:hypothetical protein
VWWDWAKVRENKKEEESGTRGRLTSESWFKASLSKQFKRPPHLQK